MHISNRRCSEGVRWWKLNFDAESFSLNLRAQPKIEYKSLFFHSTSRRSCKFSFECISQLSLADSRACRVERDCNLFIAVTLLSSSFPSEKLHRCAMWKLEPNSWRSNRRKENFLWIYASGMKEAELQSSLIKIIPKKRVKRDVKQTHHIHYA